MVTGCFRKRSKLWMLKGMESKTSRKMATATNSNRVLSVRATLDSNCFDPFLEIDDAVDVLNDLTRRGLLVMITTHVQRDELAALDRNPERRAKLLAVYDQLVMTEVPTAGALFGVSQFGGAIFGDGGTGPLQIGDIMTTNPADAEDALIAITAAVHADILVTNEVKKLPKRIKRKTDRLEVLPFEEFLERMRALKSV
jgi:hypothetical protein